MYKTKLQELCHQNSWNLPEYSTTKEGPDHDPRFQATVTVNGHSFNTLLPAKSSKKAHNDAAKLAFDHFSSVSRSSLPSPPVSTCINVDLDDEVISGGTIQSKVQETKGMHQGNGPATMAKIDDKFADTEHLYKNLLQRYAQKKSLPLPVYSCERVGPPHASRFKCTVTIDGQTYDSQEFFPTLSKAEHAAAKVALMSRATDGIEEDESAYKNLLQELAQKECYQLPAYSTVRSGEAHRPTFISTVDIEGQLFTGLEARTKKQAELSVAKVAYTALQQCNPKQSTLISTSGNSSPSPMVSCSEELRQSFDNSSQDAQSLSPPQLTSNSWYEFAAYLQQNVQPRLPGHVDQPVEDKEIVEVRSEARPIVAEAVSHSPDIVSPGQASGSSSGPAVLSLPKSGLSSSSSHSDSLTNMAVISTTEHPEVVNSSQKKVIVHPRLINMAYPPGSMILSMSDDNWVAVSTSIGSEE